MSATVVAGPPAASSSAVRFDRPARPKPPTREAVQAAIREEARYHGFHFVRLRALLFVRLMDRAFATFDKDANQNRTHYVGWLDIRISHPLMEKIMPDEMSEPRPDSAHDCINRHYAHGRVNGIIHTRECGSCGVKPHLLSHRLAA